MHHPYSVIHPEAIIGQNVEIGPFVTIDKNVIIGDNTVIASNVTILSGARIGKNCKIHSGAVISGVPQDLKFSGEETLAIIGDNTTIRECVTINRGTVSKGQTVVGSNCLIMAYCHAGHDCVIGNNVIMSNAVQLAGEVEIEDFAVLGGAALVHQFCKVGPHAMIQGGSRITKDIPPFSIVGREPAAFAGLNLVGLKRKGFDSAQIEEVQKVYKLIYQSGLNTTSALEKVEELIPESEVRNKIVTFIRNSSRGIVPFVSNKK